MKKKHNNFGKIAASALSLILALSLFEMTAFAEFRHAFKEHTWEEERAYRLTASTGSLNIYTSTDYAGKATKKESYPPQTELRLSWGSAGCGIDDQIYRKDKNDYDVSEKMTNVNIVMGGYKDGHSDGLMGHPYDYPTYWYPVPAGDDFVWEYMDANAIMDQNLRGAWDLDSLNAYGRWVIAGGAWGAKDFKRGPTLTAYKWRGRVLKGVREKYYGDWDWETYTYDPYNTLKSEKPLAQLNIPVKTSTVGVVVKSARIFSDGRFSISVRAPKTISQWGAIGFHIVAPIAKWSPYYKAGEREWAVADTGYLDNSHIIKQGNLVSFYGFIPSWKLTSSKSDSGSANIGNSSGAMQNIIDFRPGETNFNIRVYGSGSTSGLSLVRTNDTAKGANGRNAFVVLPNVQDYQSLSEEELKKISIKKDYIGNVKIDKITERTEDVSSSAKGIYAEVEWSCDEYGFNKKTPRVVKNHHLDADPPTYYNGISGYLKVYKCRDGGKEWLSNTQEAIGNWTCPETIDSFRTDGSGRAHFKSTVFLGYTTDKDCDRYRIEACAFPTPYNADWAYAVEHTRVKNPRMPYPDQDNGYIKSTGYRGFSESNGTYYYFVSSEDAKGEMYAGKASPDHPAWAKRYVSKPCANGHRYVLDKEYNHPRGCRYECEVCGEEKYEDHKFGGYKVYEDDLGIMWHSRKCACCGYEERHSYEADNEIIGTADTCVLPVCASCREYAGGGAAKLSSGHIIAFEENGDGHTHKVYCKQCGYVFDENEECGSAASLSVPGARYDLSTLARDDGGEMTCACGREGSAVTLLGTLSGTISGGVFDGVSFTALDPSSEVYAKEESAAELSMIDRNDYAVQKGNDAYIETFESMCSDGKDPENAADLAEIRAAAAAAAKEAAEEAAAAYDEEISVMSLMSPDTVTNDIITPETTAGISGLRGFASADEAASHIAEHETALKEALDGYNAAEREKNPDAVDTEPSKTSLKIGIITKIKMVGDYFNSGDGYTGDEDDTAQIFSFANLFGDTPLAQIKYNVSAVERVTAEYDGKTVASSEKEYMPAADMGSALMRLPLPADFGAEGQPVKITYTDKNGEEKTVYALIDTDSAVLEAADAAETEEEADEILKDETPGASDLRVCFISENPISEYTISASPAITSDYEDTLSFGIGTPEDTVKYSVSFSANGGSGEMAAMQIEEGTSETIKDNAFAAPEGKEFDSWNTEAGGGGTSYEANGVITVNGDVTLYAQWREPSCVIEFMSRYEGVMEKQIMPKNTETALSLNTFIPPGGKEFKCWNTKWDGSGTSYGDGEKVTLNDSSLTLYAQWDVPKETYTVTFAAGEGGSGEMAAQTFEEGGTQKLSQNEFTREGYSFRYWLTDTGLIYNDGQPLCISGNLNLTAVWVSENVTVNFYDGHGGALTATQEIPRNTPTQLLKNTAVKPGGAFNYWSTNRSNVTYDDEETVTFDNSAAESINLFAEWLGDGQTGVTVTFDRNEDFVYGVMSGYVVRSGVETALPQNTFTHKYYEFKCWNTEPDGSGTDYADGANITAAVDTVLYAQWQYKEMTLTLHYLDKETGEDIDTFEQKIRYHETAPIETPPWTNGEYALVGWSGIRDLAVVQKKCGEDYYMIGDADLYAVWASPVTVTFNAGEGSGEMASITVPYWDGSNSDEARFYLPACTFTPPEGKVFAFWTKDAANPDAPGKYYDRESALMSADRALYANYTDVYNTVTYHANYGDDETVKQYIVKNNTEALKDVFTRDGYVFEKWAKAADGTGFQGTYISMGGDLDLYAQWTKEATVTLCANYGDEPDTETVTLTGSFSAIPQPFEVPEGYEFSKWNTQADGKGTNYFGYYNSINGDVTLYAQWDKYVTITYNSNNGSGEKKEQGPAKGYVYLDENTFEAPEGYAFAGWSAEDPETVLINASSPVKVLSDKRFTDLNTLLCYNLYAVWKPAVTVTLDANGGAGSYSKMFSQGVGGYIPVFAETGITPPPGKEFDSWNTKADGKGLKKTESAYGAYGSYSADTTLYAQWKDSEKSDVSSLIIFDDHTVTYSGTEQAAEDAYIVFEGQEEFEAGGGCCFTYTYKDANGADLEGFPKNAGEYTVTAVYSDTNNWGTKTVTMTVLPKTVTVKQIYAESKIYDGTNTAEIVTQRGSENNECDGVIIEGLVEGDDISVTAESAEFVDADVSTFSVLLMSNDEEIALPEEKTVVISGLSLVGEDAANYTLESSEATTTAEISKRPVVVEGLKAESKAYDGTTDVVINTDNVKLSGVIDGEDVTVSAVSGRFKDGAAGKNKEVMVYGITLSGADADHYIIGNRVIVLSADINGDEPPAEEIEAIPDGVTLKKTEEGITVDPGDTGINKIYVMTAVFDADGMLKDINITQHEISGGSIEASLAEPETAENETYKIMVWYGDMKPLIKPISKGDAFFK